MNVSQPKASPQGHYAAVNGLQMYYEVYGEGEPLLLLHGFTNSSWQWQPLINAFAQHFQLIIPDLRGHGRSLDPSHQFTFAQAALDVFALLDLLGVKQLKAIGDSGGGCVWQYLAAQQPARLTTIILVESGYYFTEQARAILLTLVEVSDEELAGWRQYHLQGDQQTRALRRQLPKLMKDYNAQPPDLSAITAKTLLIFGDRDELSPVAVPVAMYAAIAHASLWLVPNARHAFLLEEPDRHEAIFCREALAFLQNKW